MLSSIQDPCVSCERYTASLVFHLSYGKRLARDDPDLIRVTEILQGFVRDTYPGAHIVDALPFLDYLPNILAPWRTEAIQKHEKEKKAYSFLCGDSRSNQPVGLSSSMSV